jgi:sec-independent protein translocase protein TatA
MPFKLGIVEIALILVVIFIIFGAGRLPQLFEMIGKGVRSLTGGRKKEEEVGVKKKRGRSSKS